MRNMGEERQLEVVILPWLAQGHINPFLNLSKALASHGKVLKVWFVSTPVNISKVRARLPGESSIHLLELPLPSVDGLPPGVESTADIRPESVHLLHSAFDQLEKPLETLLRCLSPDFLVYDIEAPWAATVASQLEIPSFIFSIFNPASLSYIFGHIKPGGRSKDVKAEDLIQPPIEYPLPIVSFRLFEARLVLSNFLGFADRLWECCQQSCGTLIKSCFEEENKYMQYLSRITGKPVISVGPLIMPEDGKDTSENKVIQWLDKQRPASVVYVAFGSESYLSTEQITELASALEDIGLPFLWSLRSSDGSFSSALSLLPEGFEGRTRDGGLVVGGWVPQLRILSHPSVGCFVTHGGWSSVMEAWLYAGLPLVLIPLRHEQGLNARQIDLELNGGVEVGRDEEGRFTKEEVCKAVSTVMGSNDERAEEIRSRVGELRGVIQVNTERQEAYMYDLVNHVKKFVILRNEKCGYLIWA